MDLGWIPEAFTQARILWEAIYLKSPMLGNFVIIAIVVFPFYALHIWARLSKKAQVMNNKICRTRKKENIKSHNQGDRRDR
ncbi:hypothetical protein DJ60_971 [Yersinia enterocolitica]|nr:hypothetical protein DJ60_971 [Yersinia enterocolitica]